MLYPNIGAEMGRHNVTREKLAEYLGMPVDTVDEKLNGKREITLLEIEKIASLFGCSLDYLVEHPVSGCVGAYPDERAGR